MSLYKRARFMAHGYYSDIRRIIDEKTDTTLARHYLELLNLINGHVPEDEEKLPAVPSHNVPRVHRRKKRVKSSTGPKNASATGSTVSLSEGSTMVSKDSEAVNTNTASSSSKAVLPNDDQTDKFNTWLKKKNAELKEAKRMVKLEKMRVKLQKEQEEREKEDRKREGELAYHEWLKKRYSSSAPKSEKCVNDPDADRNKQMEEPRQITDLPIAAEITDAEEKRPSLTQPVEDSLSEDSSDRSDVEEIAKEEPNKSEQQSRIPFAETDAPSMANDNPELPNNAIFSNPPPSKASSKYCSPSESVQRPVMSSTLPRSTVSERRPSNPNVQAKVAASIKVTTAEKQEDTPKKVDANLRKKITFDEWLAAQNIKSAADKAAEKAAEKERSEIRESLHKMTDSKFSARQRVENLLNGDGNNNNSSTKPTKPTSSFTSTERPATAKRFTYDNLRQSAAAAFEWKKAEKENPEVKQRTSSYRPTSASTSNSKRYETPQDTKEKVNYDRNENRESQTSSRRNQSANGSVNVSVDASSVVDSGDLFALTALSESMDTPMLGV